MNKRLNTFKQRLEKQGLLIVLGQHDWEYPLGIYPESYGVILGIADLGDQVCME